jgi:tetratricopeptide (TPR) repeat protein
MFNARANQLLAAGNARAAAAAYREALRADPNNPQLHYNLSLALDKLGDQSAQRRELEKTIQLNPDLAVAHNQLGILAMQRGRWPTPKPRSRKRSQATRSTPTPK